MRPCSVPSMGLSVRLVGTSTRAAAGEASDDDGEEGGDGVDDAPEDTGDTVDDGHDSVADGAEAALNLVVVRDCSVVNRACEEGLHKT